MKCADCDHKDVCGLRKTVQTKLNPDVCTFWKKAEEKPKQSAIERLADLGYQDVIVFENYSYEDALIGVTIDNRAVYDYDLMVKWLMREENCSQEEAVEWIDYNTVRSITRAEDPVIFYRLED